MKRMLSWILILATVLGLLPAAATQVYARETADYTVETLVTADFAPADHEQLLEGYVYQLFYGGVATYGRKSGDQLTGNDKKVYDALVPIMKQIAAGERSGTVIGLGETVTYNGQQYIADAPVAFVGTDLDMFKILNALIADMPYEMYWFDKVHGIDHTTLASDNIAHLQLSFFVAENYRGNETYSVDCQQAKTAASAAKNSAAIVDKYAGRSDYEKFLGYKDEICALVEYDYDAASAGSFSYDNDPWQLIHVFDGDTGTKVVCEGYSKAFMYLCEQSEFSADVTCITVSGQMGGPHMWNVVSIDGKSYLVDVTNSDAGTIGADGSLFLAGGILSTYSGYTVGNRLYDYCDYPGIEADGDFVLWGNDPQSILKLYPLNYMDTLDNQNFVAEGTCGENMVWRLDEEGTLTFVGSEMRSYEKGTAPWYAYRESIKKVVLSSGVLSIGEYAFYGCEALTQAVIPDGIDNIGRGAFYGCKRLESIRLPEGIRYANDHAFFGCESLKSVSIPQSMTYISRYAFYGCSSLERVTISSSVKTISTNAFGDCTSLTEVVIPQGVTTISEHAFNGCSGLETVTIPASVTKIENGAFYNCKALKDVYISDIDAWCQIEFDAGYGHPCYWAKQLHLLDESGQEVTQVTLSHAVTAIGDYTFRNMKALTKITIPSGVTSVGMYAFEGCSALTEISLPAGVTEIKEGTFRDCVKLERADISGVTAIGNYAFTNCGSLTGLTLPQNLATIGRAAFENCVALTQIHMPASVTVIAREAFQGCTGLTAVYITDLPAWCRINFGDCSANPLACAENLYLHDVPVTDLEFPGGIGAVGESAFYNCKTLTSVTIPNDVQQVGVFAFAQCSNLTDVVLKPGVKTIDECAFQQCSKLTNVSIGATVNTIGRWAFCECTSLTEIQIPDSVTDIGFHAFVSCENLSRVNIWDLQAWCQIRFEDESSNPLSNGAVLYLNGQKIQDMVIPDGTTQIGNYAFLGQKSIYTVTVPASVTAIGNYAFARCEGITDVYYLGTETQWNQISIGSDNYWLLEADLHFTNGHVHTLVYHEAKEPTCTQIGWKAYKTCSGCAYSTYEEIPFVPHDYETEYTDRTCTTHGYAISTCKDCGHTVSEIYDYSSGHAWDDGRVTVQPTEQSTGTMLYTCWFCGETKTETIPALEHIHSYIPKIRHPNCTEQGYTKYTCACGDSYTDTYVAAKGHSWGKWSVRTPAGCNIEGVEVAMCNRCKAEKTQPIQPTGVHNHVPTVTPPTCAQQGYTTYTCTCGDSYVDNYVMPLDHVMQEWQVESEANCQQAKIMRRDCSLCDYYETTKVGGPVHAMGQWEQVKAATCVVPGIMRMECTKCDYYEEMPSPAFGHEYKPTVVEPTYTQGGYTKYACHCGEFYLADHTQALGLVAPQISVSVDDESGRAVLTWNDAGEGVTYEIHRATSKKGKYTKVATVEQLNWIDNSASVGKTYYYKVKAVYAQDTSVNSDYSNVVSAAAKCATPNISVENDAKGKPYITWEKTSGAKKYTVYRATSETGNYKSLGTTTKTYYTDSKAAAGNTYYYKVIANASSSKYSSGYSNIVSCGVICGTPYVTVKIDTNTGKPSLSWKKVDAATGYAIYRDGELLTTVTAVTYTDTSASIDTQYSYAVQALGKTEDLNGQLSKEVTATSGIAKPAAKGSVDTVSGKPVLSWEAVEGAVKYEIYRSTKSSKSYKLVATVEELTYTDETVSAGKTYYYKVKAIGEVSKSADSSYVKLTGKCATPEISVTNDAKGKPYITWTKVSGAKKYTVYRATSETGKYTKLGTTTKAYYTDSKATAGKTYFYKIVANASSSKNNSPYSNIVSCGVNCATPVVKVTTNASGQPVLSWSKVSGAVKYEIYLLGAEDYVTLSTVTGTSWTDAECAVGEGRYYGVRAIAAEEAYNSEVSEPVFGRGTCATPKPTGKVGDNKKPVISWGEVEGAVKYVVYRSTSKSKGYKAIGEAEALTYEDLTAKKGKTYYYKVVAVGENCESAQSGYVKVKSK